MKRYILILLFLFSCTPDEIVEVPSLEETIERETVYEFNIQEQGIYTVTIVKENNTILTREKFNGVVGVNIKKVHKQLLPQEDLYLVLSNINQEEITRIKL